MVSARTHLVTGGAGFVGGNLIRRLRSAYPSDEIISLDNYLTSTVRSHILDERVTYLEGSTVDIERIWADPALPGPSVVYHLGEYARIVQSFEDIDACWELNLHGTKEIVKFCHAHGARLVYAGSSSKFGNDGQDENLSPYAWTKAKNVEYIENFADWFGLDFVITYFYNVYGPGHIKSGTYATAIGIFEDKYEHGEPLPVVSPGTQTRDFTHVDDIVDGIVLCAEKGLGDGYLLGVGQERPLIEVAQLFNADYVLIPARKGERERGQADATKAKDLGWEPRHSLDEYIAEFTRAHPR